GLRIRVTVVGADPHAVEQAGQKRKMLLPGHLNAGDVRAGAIDRLALGKAVESSRGYQEAHRENGVGQVFVEHPGLDHAHRLQIALDQKINVLALGWLQVGVARAEALALVVFADERGKIAKVGPGDSHAVGRADNRIVAEAVLELNAGQNVSVSLVSRHRAVSQELWRVVSGNVQDRPEGRVRP